MRPLTDIADMTRSLYLCNVRLADGQRVSVSIVDGRIDALGADAAAPRDAQIEDGGGALLLPGFVEGHTHVDKSNWGRPWYRNEVGPLLTDRIGNEREWRRTSGHDAAAQSLALSRAFVAAGTTRLRTHVDIDTDARLRHLEGVLATRQTMRDTLDMQIVAFPQSGMLIRPGTVELLGEALAEGADVLGALDPALIDGDPVASLNATLALAQRYRKPIDIHLHEPGDLGAFCLELIIERTRALSLQGRVMVSHAYCLGMLDASRQAGLIERLAAERIAVMTVGSPSAPALPLRLMRASGLTVASGSDGIQGTWEPYGNGDMLERAKYLAQRNGMANDVDLEYAARVCTFGGAEGIGLGDYGLSEGCFGDLVLVPARTLAEAVALTPRKRTVIRRGRVVVDGGELAGDLPAIE